MIPIVTDAVEVEKLSHLQPDRARQAPAQRRRVKNTTGKHLLQGPITVLEANTYAGDARIDNVPPGQERLHQLRHRPAGRRRRDEEHATTAASSTGKIVKGVLHLTRKNVFTQEYVAENKADEDKTLVIEHPFRQGWKLVEPEKADETTETLYRFRTPAPPGRGEPDGQRGDGARRDDRDPADGLGALEFYTQDGEIPKSVREALAKAVVLKHAMVDAQRQVQKTSRTSTRSPRSRPASARTSRRLPEKSALQTRLIEKLQEQEDRIDALEKQRWRLSRRLRRGGRSWRITWAI